MKDLAKKLREKCTGLFFEDRPNLQLNFGIDGNFEASRLLLVCELDKNYPKFSLSYMGLPKPVRACASQSNSFWETFGSNGLYVFHYPLNMNGVKRTLEQMAETDTFFWNGLSSEQRKLHKPPIEPESYSEHIKEKYGNTPSCIRMNFVGYMTLLGNREIMQEGMDELKKNPEAPFELMRHIVPPEHHWYIQQDDERFHSVHFYDLIRKPKEVHYKR